MVIETTLADIWKTNKANVNDMTVRRLVEMLLDKYHFKDSEAQINDPVLMTGYELLSKRISEKLVQVPC